MHGKGTLIRTHTAHPPPGFPAGTFPISMISFFPAKLGSESELLCGAAERLDTTIWLNRPDRDCGTNAGVRRVHNSVRPDIGIVNVRLYLIVRESQIDVG